MVNSVSGAQQTTQITREVQQNQSQQSPAEEVKRQQEQSTDEAIVRTRSGPVATAKEADRSVESRQPVQQDNESQASSQIANKDAAQRRGSLLDTKA